MKAAPARKEDIVWRRIDNEVVLIGNDGQAIHVLNKTAARIWELCDGANSPDDIVTALCERFNVTPEEANPDVLATLDSFEKMGLLKN